MNHSLIRAILSCALFSFVDMVAQDSTGDPQRTPVFRLLGLGIQSSELFYSMDGADIPVVIAEDYRSPFYQRPGGGALRFYTMEKTASGDLLRHQALTVALPENMRFPLILISQSGNSLAARVLDDGEKAFPGGSYRVLNELDYDVGVVLGQSRQLIRKRSEVVLEDRGGDKRTRQVQVYRDKGKEAVLLFSNNWAFNKALRTLVLINPGSGISEFPFVRRIVEPVNILDNPTPMTPPSAPEAATPSKPNP